MNGNLLRAVAWRVVVLFTLVNLLYMIVQPLHQLGFSLYNRLFPGRLRFPFCDTSEAYCVNETLLPRLFADHRVAAPKTADEYRVLVLGSSDQWGYLLRADQTMTAVLNGQQLEAAQGQRAQFYNLAFPRPDLFKQLLLVETAFDLGIEPDLIVLTLNALEFAPSEPTHWLAQDNPVLSLELIERYDITSIASDTLRVQVDSVSPLWRRTLFYQRQNAAAWFTNQMYGVAWGLLGEDYPAPETLPQQYAFFVQVDETWTRADVLAALVQQTRENHVPLVIVSVPTNYSAPNFDSWIAQQAAVLNVPLLDCAALLPYQEFTDSEIHYTPAGHRQLALQVGQWLQDGWESLPALTSCPVAENRRSP